MQSPKECDECKKEYDFEKSQSAFCSTCDKMYLCPDCYLSHICIPEKSRRLGIIGNPQWIVNLVKNKHIK